MKKILLLLIIICSLVSCSNPKELECDCRECDCYIEKAREEELINLYMEEILGWFENEKYCYTYVKASGKFEKDIYDPYIITLYSSDDEMNFLCYMKKENSSNWLDISWDLMESDVRKVY